MKKLNLGSGPDYRDGWVNVDCGDCRCDVKHDLWQTPWPFEESTVGEVLMQHILEHCPRDKFVEVVQELYRVCANGATINILSPHFSSDNFATDFTHDLPLTVRKFDYFDPNTALGKELGRVYGLTDIHLNVVSANVIPNFPNGPDIAFQLSVVKPANWS